MLIPAVLSAGRCGLWCVVRSEIDDTSSGCVFHRLTTRNLHWITLTTSWMWSRWSRFRWTLIRTRTNLSASGSTTTTHSLTQSQFNADRICDRQLRLWRLVCCFDVDSLAARMASSEKIILTSCRWAAATICPRPGLQRKRAVAALSQAGRARPDQPIRTIQPVGCTRHLPTGCTRQTSDVRQTETSDSIIA